MTPQQLYTNLEQMITERSVYAHEWSPDYHRWYNREISRLRRQLNKCGLPSRVRDYIPTDGMIDAANVDDATDLANTQADAIG